MKTIERPKFTAWDRVRAFLFLFSIVTIALIAPTLFKWFLYERAVAAPRLRSLVGRTVTMPERSIFHGRACTGKLEYVRYRPNDKWGWFDLEVSWRGDHGGGATGLSPSEAASVRAEEDS